MIAESYTLDAASFLSLLFLAVVGWCCLCICLLHLYRSKERCQELDQELVDAVNRTPKTVHE